MSAKVKRVRIVHASLEVFDNDKQARADVAKILATFRPHMIGGTESGDRERKNLIEEELARAGYIPFVPDTGDSWLGIRAKFARTYPRFSAKKVLQSGSAMHDPHHYAGKIIAKGAFASVCGPMTLIGGLHDLTKARRPGQAQQDKPGDPVDHVEASKKYMAAVVEAAEEGSRFDGRSFVTGDFNRIDRTTNLLYDNRFLSCWDESHNWPDTGHGNIDAVLRFKGDHGAELVSARALGDDEFFLNGDHKVVATEYDIEKTESHA